MSGQLNGKERLARLRLARAVLDDGGNLTEFARRAGLKLSNAHHWLKRNDADLLRSLAGGPRGKQYDYHAALVRLLLIQSVDGIRGGRVRLAKALGVTPACLSMFVKTWAPDGLDAAIADLMPIDEAA